jgi:upstream activation factor subunit UAF30
MPRPTKSSQKSTDAAAVTPAVVAAPVAAPTPAVVATEPVKKSRAKKSDAAVATPAPAVPAPVSEVATEATADESAPKTRVVPTRDSIMTDFAELLSLIDTEVARLRDSTDKNSGVKFLRTVARRVKTLHTASARVMKQKQPSARKNNNSGFLKPVPISAEMAKFTGLPADELHSRVQVTKYLCKYIKDHELQNPADKRQIVADAALSKILKYDAKTDEKPLTYYRLQSLLKNNNHFPTAPKA